MKNISQGLKNHKKGTLIKEVKVIEVELREVKEAEVKGAEVKAIEAEKDPHKKVVKVVKATFQGTLFTNSKK